MIPLWIIITCQTSVIACGLVAGVFLTFSDFVLRSLAGASTSAGAGVDVMQTISREVFRTVFMVLLLGMCVVSISLLSCVWLRGMGPASDWAIAGGVIYLAGVFFVTVVFNVALNNRLAAFNANTAEAIDFWKKTYLPRWTFWNSVRTIAASASAVSFLMASMVLAQAGALTG